MTKRAKFIEDEPSPVSYSKLNVSLHNVHDYRILFGVIRKFWLDNQLSIDFSPVTKSILNCLPLLSFVPAFFQAWTLCRFGEIKQIKIKSIKNREEIKISSSKSNHVRLVPAVQFPDDLNLKIIKDKTKIQVVSYDSYRESFAFALNDLNFCYAENILDRTHVFRHLEASYMYREGISVPDISYKLGHVIDKTTFEYIHKEWRL